MATPNSTLAAQGCLAPPPGSYVQVSEDIVRVGMTVSRVWRISADGRAQAAEWTSDGVLIAVGAAEPSPRLAALHAALAPRAAGPEAADDGSVVGRSAFHLTVAAWDPETEGWSRTATELDEELGALVETLRAAVPTGSPAPAGAFVWTQPSTLPGGPQELRLARCGDALSTALGAALASPALLAGPAEEVDPATVRAELQGRRAMGVRAPFGSFLAGVVEGH